MSTISTCVLHEGTTKNIKVLDDSMKQYKDSKQTPGGNDSIAEQTEVGQPGFPVKDVKGKFIVVGKENL